MDAYSSGNFLAPEFKKLGYPSIHVQTTKEIFSVLQPSFRKNDFSENIIFDGNFENLRERLRKYPIACLLPGTETGVELADRLSETLNLPTNGTRKSQARRNKFEMSEAVKTFGLEVAKQKMSCDVENLIHWYKTSSLKKVVIKPIASAGSEDVKICHSESDISKAFSRMMGKVNKLGHKNEALVVQEFLEGEEYFINSVSCQGKHHITDIWKHQKRSLNGCDFVYDCAELCSRQGEVEDKISDYLLKVLEALEVRFGPAHSEIMMTSTGPKLIEMGARIQGMSVPSLNQECIGYGPIDLTAEAYLNSRKFQETAKNSYQLKKYALRVNLISYKKGILKSLPGEHLLRKLETFFFLRWIKTPGMKIPRTINYFTVPGFVILVHENKEKLYEDYTRIQEMESHNDILMYE